MKKIIAKFVLWLAGSVILYVVFLGGKCWTAECFRQPFHWDVAGSVLLVLAIAWATGALIKNDEHE